MNIAPVPATAGVSFGLAAARALEKGEVDGFWANGMAAEIATRGGFGTLVIDARRSGGPKDAQHYTFPALVTAQRTIDEKPDAVAAAIRAVVRAQRVLKDDPSLAAMAAKRHFPAPSSPSSPISFGATRPTTIRRFPGKRSTPSTPLHGRAGCCPGQRLTNGSSRRGFNRCGSDTLSSKRTIVPETIYIPQPLVDTCRAKKRTQKLSH